MKILKITALTFVSLFALVVGLGIGFLTLIDDGLDRTAIKNAQASHIAYLNQSVSDTRGKVLVVVTSVNAEAQTGFKTGYELTELSRPYWVFTVNGFEVDIASTAGGEPPVVIDGDDMSEFDYAFLNDDEAQHKVRHSLKLDTVDHDQYDAVFFVGGKGTLWDFPNSPAIQSLVKNFYQSDRVIGAVCHGPAALVNVILDDGTPLVAGKEISSFTDAEELFLEPNAETVFPFLLENKLRQQGAIFNAAPNYLSQVSQDGKLLTGQNPWSTWDIAEKMVHALGYIPVEREITGEENTGEALLVYEAKGKEAAKSYLATLIEQNNQPISRQLIGVHSIVAAMEGRYGKVIDMLSLLISVR